MWQLSPLRHKGVALELATDSKYLSKLGLKLVGGDRAAEWGALTSQRHLQGGPMLKADLLRKCPSLARKGLSGLQELCSPDRCMVGHQACNKGEEGIGGSGATSRAAGIIDRTPCGVFLFVTRAGGYDLTEILYPTACVADAAFAYVNAFKAHVNVGFFRGAELADPAGLLEGTGKYMRHVKLRPDGDIDATALIRLIESAYTDMKGRLEAE